LTNVGIEGDCWSSSSYDSGNNNAGRIYFNAGNVNPVNGWYRSIGFSVRCVQASAGCRSGIGSPLSDGSDVPGPEPATANKGGRKATLREEKIQKIFFLEVVTTKSLR